MKWLLERKDPRFIPSFVQCPGCNFNFVTQEGSRGCAWYECPYLPEELKVACPRCNYNFATADGTPECSDPPTCELAAEGYRRAALARRRFGTSV